MGALQGKGWVIVKFMTFAGISNAKKLFFKVLVFSETFVSDGNPLTECSLDVRAG